MKNFRQAIAGALVAVTLVAAGCRTPAPPLPPASGAPPATAPSGASSTSTAPSGPTAQTSVTPISSSTFTVEKASFPTQMGAHYVMLWSEFQGGKKVADWKEDYRLEKAEGDLLLYAVTTERGGQKQKQQIWVVQRPDAIWFRTSEPQKEAGKETHVADGSLMFKFPMKTGDSWEITMPQGSKARREILGSEKITVPAGTFDAIRIKETREASTGDSWYVPNIGVVKSDLTGPGGRFVKELSKYEPTSP